MTYQRALASGWSLCSCSSVVARAWARRSRMDRATVPRLSFSIVAPVRACGHACRAAERNPQLDRNPVPDADEERVDTAENRAKYRRHRDHEDREVADRLGIRPGDLAD